MIEILLLKWCSMLPISRTLSPPHHASKNGPPLSSRSSICKLIEKLRWGSTWRPLWIVELKDPGEFLKWLLTNGTFFETILGSIVKLVLLNSLCCRCGALWLFLYRRWNLSWRKGKRTLAIGTSEYPIASDYPIRKWKYHSDVDQAFYSKEPLQQVTSILLSVR